MENLKYKIHSILANQLNSEISSQLCSRSLIDGKLYNGLDSLLDNQLDRLIFWQIDNQLKTQMVHGKSQ